MKLKKYATTVHKIVLRRTFEECSSWVVDAFREMAERYRPLTLLEGHHLGMDDAIFVGELQYVAQSMERYRDSIPLHGFVTEAMMQRANVISLYEKAMSDLIQI